MSLLNATAESSERRLLPSRATTPVSLPSIMYYASASLSHSFALYHTCCLSLPRLCSMPCSYSLALSFSFTRSPCSPSSPSRASSKRVISIKAQRQARAIYAKELHQAESDHGLTFYAGVLCSCADAVLEGQGHSTNHPDKYSYHKHNTGRAVGRNVQLHAHMRHACPVIHPWARARPGALFVCWLVYMVGEGAAVSRRLGRGLIHARRQKKVTKAHASDHSLPHPGRSTSSAALWSLLMTFCRSSDQKP